MSRNVQRTGRAIALTAVVAAGALALSACSGSDAPAASGSSDAKLTKVSFANQSAEGALFNQLQDGLTSSAKKLGVSLKTYNNDSDQAATLSNAQKMVLDQPDVVLDWNPVADAGARLGKTFTDADVPCIAVNTPIDGCPQFNQNNATIAEQMAGPVSKAMAARGWDGTNTTVVIMQAATVGPAVNIAVWEAYSELSKVVPGMAKVEPSDIDSQTTKIGTNGLQINDADVTLEGAFTSMQQALQTIPSTKHIVFFTVSDDFTVGAMRAIQQAGRTDDSLVSGFGCSADAIKSLRTAKTSWIAEPCTFVSAWGQYLLAMGTAIHQGVKPPKLTTAPQTILTPNNVDDYFAAGETVIPKQLPPLDAGNQYLAKTGVLQQFGNVQDLK